MRHVTLLIASATMALAACTSHDAPGVAARGAIATPQQATIAHAARTIATLPDRGHLLSYANSEPVRRTAYTWHPASLSEAHALRAIATGTLEVAAPDGTPIRLRYARHVEHEDGNWTWIGRPDGAQPGTEAIITFGDKAVFGSLPNPKGGPPLRITTSNGRTWVMETDPRALKRLVAEGRAGKGDDVQSIPALASARDQVVRQASLAPQQLTAAGAVPESATVDVAIGYTNTFASRLGGASQALTRLRYLIDVANLAFSNSQIVGQVRLAGTIALNYPDNTDNGAALDQLTGMTCDTTCTDIPIPATLQPLHTLREQVKADLISMVRNFSDPENQSCGNAWLLGGGGETIVRDMAYAAVSVVSDSNGNMYPDNDFICRDETFVHELGHNMGSNHDAETSAGDDGVVDEEDEGAFPYSFGYKTAVGNFYTIMAYRDDGQTPFRVFSNPRITSCDGYPCGTASADNARSLGQTMPIVATFYTRVLVNSHDDFDGNLLSDIVWRNTSSGANALWRGASSSAAQALMGVADQAWKVAGTGDFDGDKKADLLWRNTRTGANAIWRSANGATAQTVTTVASQDWQVAGVGDFDGEGHADILWRHRTTGQNVLFRGGLGTGAGPVSLTTAPVAWKVAGVGDFNADGRADILWRNTSTGQNAIWHSGSAGTAVALVTAPQQAWTVAGVGDFDADGRDDVLWRNTTSGSNQLWPAGVAANARILGGVSDQNFRVARVADYNGDGVADILWRNGVTGLTILWRGGNNATQQTVGTVAASWIVAGN